MRSQARAGQGTTSRVTQQMHGHPPAWLPASLPQRLSPTPPAPANPTPRCPPSPSHLTLQEIMRDYIQKHPELNISEEGITKSTLTKAERQLKDKFDGRPTKPPP